MAVVCVVRRAVVSVALPAGAMLGERKWSKNIAIVIPVVIGFWYLMSQMLGVYVAPLPEIFGV